MLSTMGLMIEPARHPPASRTQDPAARFRDKMVTLDPVLTCPAPAEGDRMSCAPPLKPVSFLIDFRVLTSWSPYLPNRTNVRFWHKADMAIALNDVRFRG
jgi:hypothetical protein